ncbi:MAG: hypothetical protein MJ252_24705 [archaeon]|nr:hypothetical protein [archaeon]
MQEREENKNVKSNESHESAKDKNLLSKQKQILSMASDLKSHLLLGKIFVDPDKNITKLLSRIIVSLF